MKKESVTPSFEPVTLPLEPQATELSKLIEIPTFETCISCVITTLLYE